VFHSLDTEVLMAAAYSVFLVLAAFGLEWAARQSHRRCEQVRIAGFKYHQQHDRWECPMGQQLTLMANDQSRRLVRYRAPANVCNACSMKDMCTTSNSGREIEYTPDSWLQSELAHFQRGISLTLIFLAELLIVIEIFLHSQLLNLLFLLAFLVPITLLWAQRVYDFVARIELFQTRKRSRT
jgi:DDE family transposase